MSHASSDIPEIRAANFASDSVSKVVSEWIFACQDRVISGVKKTHVSKSDSCDSSLTEMSEPESTAVRLTMLVIRQSN